MKERPPAAASPQPLGWPIVIGAIVVGIATLAYWQLYAPGRPGVPTLAAPQATQFPTTTPGPSPTFGPLPTPGLESPIGRDLQRKRDLALVAAALDRYFAVEGSFPATGPDVRPLCLFGIIDAGCNLAPYVVGELPRDSRVPYRYVSDGSMWTIFAEFEAIAPADRCSDARAKTLPNAYDIFCVTGGAPTDPSP